ncbi:hypothetical protein L6452_12714 [Arctium lappa]|uniref:Uncharacterized protein n=1 Tax=Arctium lappa TaxID=4217 RepID=A0ACB9DS21_ARCLA|nr:hypothetical protein L6452_12714 [Arctium lappa]
MTNICGFLCILTRKHGKKMVQVQRQDGKTLELTVPILVGELLQKFPGAAGVGLSNNSHHQLPLTYKLKLGKMYYLLPPKSTPEAGDEAASSSKRIKMVITKQQLQQLIISRQITLQDAADKQSPLNYPYWRPQLQSIPEAEAEGDE